MAACLSATCPIETFLPILLRSNFSFILKGYAGWAEHCFDAKIPEVVLCWAVFSEANDCADLVQSL
jgi:hypothetical protein